MPLDITLASIGQKLVIPALKTAGSKLLDARQRRNDRIVEEELTTLLRAVAVTDEENAYAQAEELLTSSSPETDELLAQWQNSILDATLPDARTFLTLLFATYLVHGIQADTFLRRTGKMLRDIDQSELDSTSLLLSAISKAQASRPVNFISFTESRTHVVHVDGTTFDVKNLDGRPAARVLASSRVLEFESGNIPLCKNDLAEMHLDKLLKVFGRKAAEIQLIPSGRRGLEFPK